MADYSDIRSDAFRSAVLSVGPSAFTIFAVIDNYFDLNYLNKQLKSSENTSSSLIHYASAPRSIRYIQREKKLLLAFAGFSLAWAFYRLCAIGWQPKEKAEQTHSANSWATAASAFAGGVGWVVIKRTLATRMSVCALQFGLVFGSYLIHGLTYMITRLNQLSNEKPIGTSNSSDATQVLQTTPKSYQK